MFRSLQKPAAGTAASSLFAILALPALFTVSFTLSTHAATPVAVSLTAPSPCRESAAPGKQWRCLPARDGTLLAAQSFAAESDLTIVLLHGVLSSSAGMRKTAELLHEATRANVLALDLRGHGKSGGRPGDNDYIGQWEDDLADVVKQLRQEKPHGRIVLAGHAVGGGVVLRYAEKPKQPAVDGYLLFAPDLGWDSPTTRKEAPPEAKAGPKAEPFMKVDIVRIIKLKALNAVGITSSNDEVTLTFSVPKSFPVSKYTYRAMTNFSPEDYRVALAADARPLLLVAGSKDEAYHADRYPAALATRPGAKVVLVEGETHMSVLQAAGTVAAVRDWVPTLRK